MTKELIGLIMLENSHDDNETMNVEAAIEQTIEISNKVCMDQKLKCCEEIHKSLKPFFDMDFIVHICKIINETENVIE